MNDAETGLNNSGIESAKGFTLVELLVAVSIFSVIAVALYSTFATGLDAWKRMEQASALNQEARLALQRICLELRNALDFPGIEFSGQANRLSFAALVNAAGPGAEQRLQIARISYFPDDVPGTGLKSLLRRQQIYPQQTAGEINAREEESDELICSVAEGGLNFEYSFQGETLSEGRASWKDTWIYGDNNRLPLGVRVSLSLQEAEDDNDQVTYIETVLIPAGALGILPKAIE